MFSACSNCIVRITKCTLLKSFSNQLLVSGKKDIKGYFTIFPVRPGGHLTFHRPSLWRSNLCKKYCRIISHLSPAKPYLYPSHTMCFLNHTDGPLFPPLLSPLPLTTPPPSPLPLTTPPHHSPSPLRSYSPLLTPFPIITSLHSPHPYSHQCTPPFTPLLLTTPLTTPSRYPSPPLTTPHHPLPPLLTYPPHHTSSPPSSPLSSSPTFLTTHLFTTLFTPHPTTPKREIITPKDSWKVIFLCL